MHECPECKSNSLNYDPARKTARCCRSACSFEEQMSERDYDIWYGEKRYKNRIHIKIYGYETGSHICSEITEAMDGVKNSMCHGNIFIEEAEMDWNPKFRYIELRSTTVIGIAKTVKVLREMKLGVQVEEIILHSFISADKMK